MLLFTDDILLLVKSTKDLCDLLEILRILSSGLTFLSKKINGWNYVRLNPFGLRRVSNRGSKVRCGLYHSSRLMTLNILASGLAMKAYCHCPP